MRTSRRQTGWKTAAMATMLGSAALINGAAAMGPASGTALQLQTTTISPDLIARIDRNGPALAHLTSSTNQGVTQYRVEKGDLTLSFPDMQAMSDALGNNITSLYKRAEDIASQRKQFVSEHSGGWLSKAEPVDNVVLGRVLDNYRVCKSDLDDVLRLGHKISFAGVRVMQKTCALLGMRDLLSAHLSDIVSDEQIALKMDSFLAERGNALKAMMSNQYDRTSDLTNAVANGDFVKYLKQQEIVQYPPTIRKAEDNVGNLAKTTARICQTNFPTECAQMFKDLVDVAKYFGYVGSEEWETIAATTLGYMHENGIFTSQLFPKTAHTINDMSKLLNAPKMPADVRKMGIDLYVALGSYTSCAPALVSTSNTGALSTATCARMTLEAKFNVETGFSGNDLTTFHTLVDAELSGVGPIAQQHIDRVIENSYPAKFVHDAKISMGVWLLSQYSPPVLEFCKSWWQPVAGTISVIFTVVCAAWAKGKGLVNRLRNKTPSEQPGEQPGQTPLEQLVSKPQDTVRRRAADADPPAVPMPKTRAPARTRAQSPARTQSTSRTRGQSPARESTISNAARENLLKMFK